MKISELAKQAKVSIDTIRYYESRQLLPLPPRKLSGYRDYSANHVRHLLFIIHAKELGFTLTEIKELLSLRQGSADCLQVKTLALTKANAIALRIKSLSQMKSVLLELAEKCAQQGDDNCPILKSLEANDE